MKGRFCRRTIPTKSRAYAVYLDLPISYHSCCIEVPRRGSARTGLPHDGSAQVGPFDERLGPGASDMKKNRNVSAVLSGASESATRPRRWSITKSNRSRATASIISILRRERGRWPHEFMKKHSATEGCQNAVALSPATLCAISRRGLRESRGGAQLAIARGISTGLGGHS